MIKRSVLLLAIPAVLLALAGCGTVDKSYHERLSTDQVQSYAEGVLEPEELALFDVPYEINAELAKLAAEYKNPAFSDNYKAKQIARLLLSEEFLGIEYTRYSNYSALQVYEHRKANCISFTNLFIGMARSVNLKAYYAEVTEIESFDKVGNTVVYNSHICAVVFSGPNAYLVDFTLRDHPQYHSWHAISDLEAVANFYNNIGSHLYLNREDPDYAAKAMRYFRMALKLYPDSAPIYNNIGVLMLHQNDEENAERMFRKALALKPGYFAAYNNLGNVYVRRGEPAKAMELVSEAIAASPDNPYAYHTLAKLLIGDGNYEGAERNLRKALRINKRYTAARHELGRLYLRTGRGREALKQFALALKYHPDDSVARGKVELIRKLSLDRNY